MKPDQRRLLITDLDNTLWDWFEAWYLSFSALLDSLIDVTGVERSLLEAQIRDVHQLRGTTEYSNLLREVPIIRELAGSDDPTKVFNEAVHAQNSARISATHLYPTVLSTLKLLKQSGVRIVAYTESGAFWTEWRMRRTGIDGLVDVLYSSPDHDVAAGVDVSQLRTGYYDSSYYGLRQTKHIRLPLDTLKPNIKVIAAILSNENVLAQDAAYIGDSLIKDIAMAQAAGVLDVFAEYGTVQHRIEYDLLRRVSHWSEEDVEYERKLSLDASKVHPSVTCRSYFSEVLQVFNLTLPEAENG